MYGTKDPNVRAMREARMESKVAAYAAVLVAENWPPEAALARASFAYCGESHSTRAELNAAARRGHWTTRAMSAVDWYKVVVPPEIVVPDRDRDRAPRGLPTGVTRLLHQRRRRLPPLGRCERCGRKRDQEVRGHLVLGIGLHLCGRCSDVLDRLVVLWAARRRRAPSLYRAIQPKDMEEPKHSTEIPAYCSDVCTAMARPDRAYNRGIRVVLADCMRVRQRPLHRTPVGYDMTEPLPERAKNPVPWIFACAL